MTTQDPKFMLGITLIGVVFKRNGNREDNIHEWRELEGTVTTTFLPYDSERPPPTKKRNIIHYCSNSRRKQLISVCDENAHIKYEGMTIISSAQDTNAIPGLPDKIHSESAKLLYKVQLAMRGMQ